MANASTAGSFPTGGMAGWRRRDPGWGVLLAILLGLTALRLTALAASRTDLGFDEAQYWAWSRHFAFGYFSKPPLIAWVISVERGLCGDGAACVRAASPLAHCGAALLLALLARRLYGPAAGFWTGLFYALMPGVSLSAMLISTDAFLLFFWSAALYALFRYLDSRRLLDALLFAAATALGLYAKYAMIFLPLVLLLATAFMPDLRAKLYRPNAGLALVAIVLMMLPNLWWNYGHGFATFEHTGSENIGWRLSRLNPTGGFEFLASQFGAAGPIIFGAMIAALWPRRPGGRPETDRLLIWLSWPILLAIALQGFLSQANANWGATAYPAGVALATAAILSHRSSWPFAANLAICGLAALAIPAFFAFADPTAAKGPIRQFRQLGGWSETSRNLAAVARTTGADRLVVEGRALTAGLTWGLRDEPLRILALLPKDAAPGDQFELEAPWRAGDDTERTLLVGVGPDAAARLGARALTTIDAPVYSADRRRLTVYAF